MKNYLIIIVLLFSSCAYDPPSAILEIVNNSENGYFVITKVDTVSSMSGYGVPYFSKNDLMPKDTLELSESSPNGWHIIFNEVEKNKLYLFIFNQDSIKKYHDVEELVKRRQYDILKFTEKELDELDWKITISK